MRKAQEFLRELVYLMRMVMVLLAALLPEKVPGGLLPRADSRYQWEAAAHLPENIESRAWALSGVLPGLPGMDKGSPVPPEGLVTR